MPSTPAAVGIVETEVRQPAWYRVYFQAMVENDRNSALAKIECAQKAIRERVSELREFAPSDVREVQDLTNALIYLGILLMHIGDKGESRLWD